MTETSQSPAPPVSQTDIAAMVAAQVAALNLGDVGSVVLADLPDPANWSRRTIWVTDLWRALPVAQRGGRMVSEGGYWKPLRPLVAYTAAVASMETTPLVTPTTLFLTNASALGVGVTRTVTLGMGSGFAVPAPGYRQRIVKPAGALGVLNVIGGTLLAPITKALSGWADFEWDGTQWSQSASGGLL